MFQEEGAPLEAPDQVGLFLCPNRAINSLPFVIFLSVLNRRKLNPWKKTLEAIGIDTNTVHTSSHVCFNNYSFFDVANRLV